MNATENWWRVDRHILYLEGGRKCEFPYPILEAVAVEEMVVVVLETSGKRYTENVFGVTREGAIAWQIPKLYSARLPPRDGPWPYVGVTYVKNKLWLTNFNSHLIRVDPKTGEQIGEAVFTK